MTTTQLASIEAHGRNLLAIFPNAVEKDPIALCKKLRRLESVASKLALRACNGPSYANEGDEERLCDALLAKVKAMLGVDPAMDDIFVNLDARGYALKIDYEWMREHRDTPLHSDWGGYGILAPEINS